MENLCEVGQAKEAEVEQERDTYYGYNYKEKQYQLMHQTKMTMLCIELETKLDYQSVM